MFKLERTNKKEEGLNQEETSILQRTRDSKMNGIVKPLIVGSIIGLGVGSQISKKIDKINENNIEFSKEKEKAEKYEIKENQFIGDTIKYLSDEFVSNLAIKVKDIRFLNLSMDNDYLTKEIIETESKINNPEIISKELENNKKYGVIVNDTVSFKKQYDEFLIQKVSEMKKQIEANNLIIEKGKSTLTENDKEKIKLKIIEIILLVEQAKLEIIKHIGSSEYLEKLSNEMNISERSAKEHQRVRINNIKNISYNLKTNDEILANTNDLGHSYYLNKANKIFLPYTVNLNDKKEKDFLYESIVHEILHESIIYNSGISVIAEEFLRDSFKNTENETKEDSIYYSEPGELIVRKQILDLNMDKNGIKKYGEKFNEEHYKKLIQFKKEGKLTPNENQFIEHIKPEDFINIMNKLAENQNQEKDDYYNPEWNYGENQA